MEFDLKITGIKNISRVTLYLTKEHFLKKNSFEARVQRVSIIVKKI